jgi:hypothetical protein
VISYTPQYSQSGYWDGDLSPLYRPSRKTMTWILPGLSIALGYENIEPGDPLYPLLLFYINALNVAVVTDAATINHMLSTPPGQPGAAKIFTIAGIQPTGYDMNAHYGMAGVTLDATPDEVAKVVSEFQQVGAPTRSL